MCVLFIELIQKQESFIQLIFAAPPKKHSLLLLKLELHHADSMMESPILSPFLSFFYSLPLSILSSGSRPSRLQWSEGSSSCDTARETASMACIASLVCMCVCVCVGVGWHDKVMLELELRGGISPVKAHHELIQSTNRCSQSVRGVTTH